MLFVKVFVAVVVCIPSVYPLPYKLDSKDYIVSVHTDDFGAHLGEIDFSIDKKFTIGNLSGYRVFADYKLYEKLVKSSYVVDIEEDIAVFTESVNGASSWGLDRVNQRNASLDGNIRYSGNGAGVNVYVIDTGINVEISDFGGRAVWGSNFARDGIDTDCHGHGTHVAGTIGSNTYGIATNANLIAVKVFGCSGSGRFSAIIEGLDWVTRHCLKSGARCVVNMSLGGAKSILLNHAVAESVSAGLHNIVSAGNDNTDACDISPASASSAVTVASTTIRDSRSSFSNWGRCVDIFAPGSKITSWSEYGTPWTISGTSMAAPHVSGVVARILGETDLTPAEMAHRLSQQATSGKVFDTKGSNNLLLYIDPSCSEGKTLIEGVCVISNNGFINNVSVILIISLLISL